MTSRATYRRLPEGPILSRARSRKTSATASYHGASGLRLAWVLRTYSRGTIHRAMAIACSANAATYATCANSWYPQTVGHPFGVRVL